MKILVTGANGFVGSTLMPSLEKLGHEVSGIDRDATPLYNIHPNTVIANIADINTIQQLQQNFDIIIHCAAAKSDFGVSDAEYFYDNETITKILCDYAENLQIKKILYYSTVSVYGHQSKPCGEEGELLSNTVYGDSKLAGEVVIEKWVQNDSTRKAVFLRPSVIYGPNNYANMYNLIHTMYGNPLLMVGKGKHVKSMVALSNLVDMTIFTLNHSFKTPLDVYNCLDKPYYSVNQLMQLIAKTKGFNMPKINIPVGLAYVLITPFELASKLTGKDFKINWNRLNKFSTATDYLSEKIRSEGYVQRFTVEEEITKMVHWYQTTKQ